MFARSNSHHVLCLWQLAAVLLSKLLPSGPFVAFVTGSWDDSDGAAGSLFGASVGAGVAEMDGAGCLVSLHAFFLRLGL